MKTLNGLPVYKMTINETDDTTGVEFISLVDFPAIEVNWVALSTNKLKLFASSVDKQILTGPAMIPDLPIYRADASMGEYYVSFDASEIEKISRKFNKEQRTLGINYQHQNDSQVKSAVIVEQWFITDANNDKAKALGFDLPIGTWMVSVHIADSDFWTNEIKSGNVRGFSIEGFLNLEMSKVKPKLTLESLMQEINKLTKIVNNMKVTFKAEIKTKDGATIYTDGDAFVEGASVWSQDADGNQTPVADGDVVLENGTTITVSAGKITKVVEPAAASVTPADDATKMALTPEDIQAVADALKISDILARLDALEAANTAMKAANEELTRLNKELEEKFNSTPGAAPKTNKTDKTEVQFGTKMSFTDKVNAIKALKK